MSGEPSVEHKSAGHQDTTSITDAVTKSADQTPKKSKAKDQGGAKAPTQKASKGGVTKSTQSTRDAENPSQMTDNPSSNDVKPKKSSSKSKPKSDDASAASKDKTAKASDAATEGGEKKKRPPSKPKTSKTGSDAVAAGASDDNAQITAGDASSKPTTDKKPTKNKPKAKGGEESKDATQGDGKTKSKAKSTAAGEAKSKSASKSSGKSKGDKKASTDTTGKTGAKGSKTTAKSKGASGSKDAGAGMTKEKSKSKDKGENPEAKKTTKKSDEKKSAEEKKVPMYKPLSAAAAAKLPKPRVNKAALNAFPTMKTVYDRAMRRITDGDRTAQLQLSLDVPALCHFLSFTRNILKCDIMKPAELEAILCTDKPFEQSPQLTKIVTNLLLASKKDRSRLLASEAFDPTDLDVLIELFVTRLYERAQKEGKQRDKIVQDEEDDDEEDEDNDADEEEEEEESEDDSEDEGSSRKRRRDSPDTSKAQKGDGNKSSKRVKADEAGGDKDEENEETTFKTRLPAASLGIDLDNGLAVIASVDKDLAYAALQLAHAGEADPSSEHGIPMSVLKTNPLAAELVDFCTKNENLADSMRFDLRMLFDTWNGSNPFSEGQRKSAERCKELRDQLLAERMQAEEAKSRARMRSKASDADYVEVSDLELGITAVDKYPGFSSLSPVDRLRVLYLLCEYRAHAFEVHSSIHGVEIPKLRIDPIGTDSRGFMYYTIAKGDYRMYIQQPRMLTKFSGVEQQQQQQPEDASMATSESSTLNAPESSQPDQPEDNTMGVNTPHQPESQSDDASSAPPADVQSEAAVQQDTVNPDTSMPNSAVAAPGASDVDTNGALAQAEQSDSTMQDEPNVEAKAEAASTSKQPPKPAGPPKVPISTLYVSYYDYSSFLTDGIEGKYEPTFKAREPHSADDVNVQLPECGLLCTTEDEFKQLILTLKRTNIPQDATLAVTLFRMIDEMYGGRLHYETMNVMTDTEYAEYKAAELARSRSKTSDEKKAGSGGATTTAATSSSSSSASTAGAKKDTASADTSSSAEPPMEYRRSSTRLQLLHFDQREQDRLQALVEEETRKERMRQREREIRKWASELMNVLDELTLG